MLKRPYVDEFLQRMGELFECVLFTASLSKYADPVADLLDKWGVFRYITQIYSTSGEFSGTVHRSTRQVGSFQVHYPDLLDKWGVFRYIAQIYSTSGGFSGTVHGQFLNFHT